MAIKFSMISEDLSVADKFSLLKDLRYDGVEIGYGDKVDPAEVVKAIEDTQLPVLGLAVVGLVVVSTGCEPRQEEFRAVAVQQH